MFVITQIYASFSIRSFHGTTNLIDRNWLTVSAQKFAQLQCSLQDNISTMIAALCDIK